MTRTEIYSRALHMVANKAALRRAEIATRIATGMLVKLENIAVDYRVSLATAKRDLFAARSAALVLKDQEQ